MYFCLLQTIPHFGYCDEIDISELIKIKKDFQKLGAEYGIRITYMPFFVKSASLALAQFPILNSSIDLSSEQIIFKVSYLFRLLIFYLSYSKFFCTRGRIISV